MEKIVRHILFVTILCIKNFTKLRKGYFFMKNICIIDCI